MWRETLALIWHWLTTSRYTRRLEQEVEFFKADNARLRRDNDGLLQDLHPNLRKIRSEQVVRDEGPRDFRPIKF
jgi:hypothetical protein